MADRRAVLIAGIVEKRIELSGLIEEKEFVTNKLLITIGFMIEDIRSRIQRPPQSRRRAQYAVYS